MTGESFGTSAAPAVRVKAMRAVATVRKRVVVMGKSSARLRHDGGDRLGLLDSGEAQVEALELVGQPFVVDAAQPQHGRVQVADVDRVLDAAVAQLVGRAVG